MANATLAYHLEHPEDLPVSPPASPGDEGDGEKRPTTKARTPQTVTAADTRVAIANLCASLDEARTADAPVGILLQLAKNLSSARQRAKVGQTATSEMRAMELEAVDLPADAGTAGDEAETVSLAAWERTLNREARFCDEALAEACWVREFGDSVISESEQLAVRRAAYAHESAALFIQDAWRNFKAPPLVDTFHELDYTPAKVYLAAEAASRIQSVARGRKLRLDLAAELGLLEQLATLSPRTDKTIYWPSCLKLFVTVTAAHAVFAYVAFVLHHRGFGPGVVAGA